MFLHCVAQDKAEVKVPWTKFRQHSNSLFLFRIALWLISLVVIALAVVPGIFVGFALARTGARAGLVLTMVAIGLVVFVISIAFAIVYKFTAEFVVPIMFLRTPSCRAAWREFLGVLSVNKGRFLLYLLFKISTILDNPWTRSSLPEAVPPKALISLPLGLIQVVE